MPAPPAILIVEDDAATAKVVEGQLLALGYRIAGTVASGEAALERLPALAPDLVIMDVALGGVLDGVETAATLLRARQRIPVIFLTERNDSVTLKRIQDTSPFGFLAKPPSRDELGTIIAIALQGHAMESRARASEEHLAAILDGIGDAVIAVDQSEVIGFMNARAVELTGWSQDEGRGQPVGRLLSIIDARTEEGRRCAPSWGGAASAAPMWPSPCLMTLRRRDGSERHVRLTASPLPDRGQVLLLGDLTEHRQVETDLRRTSRALKVLSESLRAVQGAQNDHDLLHQVCRLVVDTGGYRLAWVGIAEHDSGSSVRAVAQAGYPDRYLEEVHTSWDERSAGHGPTGEAIRTGQVVIARDIMADDRYRDWRLEAAKRGYASAVALPLLRAGQIFGALTIYAIEAESFDASELELLRELAHQLSYGLLALRIRAERARAEQDLLKAEARYRQLVEQIPVVTYIAALDDLNSMLYLSPQIELLTGFPPDRWISGPAFFVNRLFPGDRMRVLGELARCKQQGVPLTIEYRLVANDGHIVWVGDEAKVVRDDADRPQFIHGVITDITQRKLAEESLRQAHDALRALINAAPLAICMIDPQGRVSTVWNPAAERLFGWTQAEALGQFMPIVAPEDRDSFHELLGRVLGGESLTGVEIRRRRKDGTKIDLSLAAAPLAGADGRCTGVIALLNDITQSRRAEVALAAAQRDATVGRMAAVVAHEVNNPLAAIKAWLGLLRSDLAQSPTAVKNLAMIGEQVDRIARTVRNLLGFSRQREAREAQVPSSSLIRTVGELFQGRMQAKGIHFEVRVPEHLPAVRGDADQLQEVLINLLENACQALDRGGHVAVVAGLRGQRLEVEVADDGVGLGADPERLFTPFFTTKVNGTGLGLTVARRICEAHGGRLEAGASATGGARFLVSLPVATGVEAKP